MIVTVTQESAAKPKRHVAIYTHIVMKVEGRAVTACDLFLVSYDAFASAFLFSQYGVVR